MTETKPTESELTIAERLLTIESIVETAHANISRELWDYGSGGAETEMTLRRNRAGFERIAFRPRILRDVSVRTANTSLLGQELSIPVFLPPVASVHRYHAEGAVACAQAAAARGTLMFLSNATEHGLDEVMAGTAAPVVFQLYLRGDRQWLEDQVNQAQERGCTGLCYTADLDAPGHRERNLLNHFGGPRGVGTRVATSDLFDRHAAFTWDDLAWLRGVCTLPLILKGVTSPADAVLAVEHGVDVIYVSNHGGRQLDHLPATIEVLPEILAAVDGRAEVIVDGGIIRGSDVVKAIALGARAVGIGKLMLWALAIAGRPGVERALTLLEQEIYDLLGHLGVRSVSELAPEYLAPASVVPASDWVGFR